MKTDILSNIPLSSYQYYATCELTDAIDNLETITSRLEDDSARVLFLDIVSDIYSALDKLENISL